MHHLPVSSLPFPQSACEALFSELDDRDLAEDSHVIRGAHIIQRQAEDMVGREVSQDRV